MASKRKPRAKVPSDTDRVVWLAEHMWWDRGDAGLPDQWSVRFRDYANQRKRWADTFDAAKFRTVIDAAMERWPTKRPARRRRKP